MLSVLTPAFNEAENLDSLYARLRDAMAAQDMAWEWIVVDDHSVDGTFTVIRRLSERDPRVRGLRLARNSGSHVAIACALHHVRGDAAVMMAADLQDPPETLGAMIGRWRQGAQVVWAARRVQPGQRTHARFAAFYYWMMRRVVGMTELPTHGADFFLLDRVVVDAFCTCRERNLSVFALIAWLGFRQEQIEYDKAPRAAGRSGWTLRKKLRLVVDSVASFSAFPIRLCSVAGVGLVVVGCLLGLAAMSGALGGSWAIAALMCGLTGIQLLGLGVLGEYIWRALEEARQRPVYVVEATTIPGADRAG